MIAAKYDALSDVMYVTVDQPRPAYSHEQANGLVYRYDRESKQPCGVTVLDYSENWDEHVCDLAKTISSFLHDRPDHVRELLSAARSYEN